MNFLKPLAVLACLLALPAAAEGSLILQGSTDSLEVVTSASGSVDYHASWANVTATALTTPGTGNGNIASATTTTVVTAPAASNWRHVRSLSVFNASATVANTVTIQVNRSAATRILCKANLAPQESIDLFASGSCSVFDAYGRPKVSPSDPPGFNGRNFNFTKVATAPDAAGYHYMYAKDTGFPGAYALGTPGLSGATLDCSSAAGAAVSGSHVLPNATSAWYLTRYGLNSSVVSTHQLLDLVWYNTGITVTTTTAQTVNSVAFPARDLNGATSGEGYQAAMYFSVASTAAATIANTTIDYTNSQGTPGRTGTLSAVVGFQSPATPVVGTWVPFQLQAGDTGIQSIQGITLGTSYVTGTINLFVYRPLSQDGVGVANAASGSLNVRQSLNPGVRIFNGTCFGWALSGASSTTAASIYNGTIELMDR